MLYTITSAARVLGKSRQWISGIVNRHDIGTRVTPTVVYLTDADILQIRRTMKENYANGKFMTGNELHRLRKKHGRNKPDSGKS